MIDRGIDTESVVNDYNDSVNNLGVVPSIDFTTVTELIEWLEIVSGEHSAIWELPHVMVNIIAQGGYYYPAIMDGEGREQARYRINHQVWRINTSLNEYGSPIYLNRMLPTVYGSIYEPSIYLLRRRGKKPWAIVRR